MTRFETQAYENAHGKKPTGFGYWGFIPTQLRNLRDTNIQEYDANIRWYTGKYSEVKKLAARELSNHGYVTVLP